jgi:hypothetical protein
MSKAPTASNALIHYEAGQTYVPMAALTNSGDNTIFTSGNSYWSGYEGKEPVVRPNGMLTGGVITPAASGVNNQVDVSAGTAYLAGALISIPAILNLTVLRGVTTDVYRVNSIVAQRNIGDTAYEYAVESGVDNTVAATTRGDAGAPPLIPVAEIEVGQVIFTAILDAAVKTDEIFQVEGTHKEMSDFPVWEEDWLNGKVTFAAAFPAIHVGTPPTAKRVFAAYYTPVFAEVPNGSDFAPAETTHSVSSTQIYGGTIGARSSSLSQGSFTARLPKAGVGDGLIKQKNKNIWLKFYPDRYKDSHLMTQGVLGISRSYPAGDSIVTSCTISPESATDEVEA